MLNCNLYAQTAKNYMFKTKEGSLVLEVEKRFVSMYSGRPCVDGNNGHFNFFPAKKPLVSAEENMDCCKILGLPYKAYLNSPMNAELTYKLLCTIDSILFSSEFSSRFAVIGTSNYRCSEGGISVDCYTVVPCVYGYDEFKNSLVSFLKPLGTQFKVAVHKNGKTNTFAFTLRVMSAKEDIPLTPLEATLVGYQTPARFLKMGAAIYGGDSGVVTTVLNAAKKHSPETGVLPTDINLRSQNYRLIPINGSIYFLTQYTRKQIYSAKTLLEALCTTWKKILETPLIDEMKIGGTNHGFSTIPYLEGASIVHIDIPIRTSLLPYTTEEIKAALEDELSELLLDIKVAKIEWNVLSLQLNLLN